MQLTLTADLSSVVTSPQLSPERYTLRTVKPDDLDALGTVYFASYPPGVAGNTVEEATDDIRATFNGDYGELWLDASFVAEYEGALVGAIQIVRSAPWDDVPTGPFIIELFVHPRHRRRRLARELLWRALITVRAAGESSVALRAASDNTAALGLYRAAGFVSANGR